VRTDRPGQRSPLGLGALETAIMEVLWAADRPLMVREIRDGVDYPTVAYTTVAAITAILCGKGLVHRELIDRPGLPGPPVWQHRAARPASEHIGDLIATLLDRSPSPAETLAHALSTARTAHQLDRTIWTGRQEHCHDV
jgi:predicted transcriptional regulator